MSLNKRIITKNERQLLIDLLKKAREDSGLRQIDLASKLGKNQSYVRMICEAISISFIEFVKEYEGKLSAIQKKNI